MAISIFGTKANNTDIVVKDTATGDVDLSSGDLTTTGDVNSATLTATGTVAANLFSGSGASLTALQSAQLTGALPAIDGSALTGISSIGSIEKMVVQEYTAATSGSGGFSNTGLEVTITPASASNKILLLVTGSCATNVNTLVVRFTENNVAVALGDPAGSRTRVSFKVRGQHDNNHSATLSGSAILAPNSTSALTYRVQMTTENNNSWYINRSVNDSNQAVVNHARGATYFYAIELANTTINT